MTQWPYDALEYLCQKVDLMRVTQSPSVPGILSPDGMALWTSSYAQLLLWPVLHRAEPGVLRAAAVRAQDWFDHILLNAEARDRRTIDGYLILSLASSPTADEEPRIQSLQFSTQVCRKHVIWPDPSAYEGWHGLLDITVLAPPDGIASAADADWPTLDPSAEIVWRRVADLGHNAAAQLDLEEA